MVEANLIYQRGSDKEKSDMQQGSAVQMSSCKSGERGRNALNGLAVIIAKPHRCKKHSHSQSIERCHVEENRAKCNKAQQSRILPVNQEKGAGMPLQDLLSSLPCQTDARSNPYE